jgi:hypothetical protein
MQPTWIEKIEMPQGLVPVLVLGMDVLFPTQWLTFKRVRGKTLSYKLEGVCINCFKSNLDR